MVKIRVEEVKPGFILQKDVMGKTKNPIIPANTVLTNQHIQILNMFFIHEVYVQTAAKLNKDSKEKVSDDSFYSSYTKAVEYYKREFHSWQAGINVNIANIRRILLPLMEIYKSEKNWLKRIHLYSTKEDYLFHHAIGVALISHFIAEELNYDKGQSLQVALAGCLADCGMAKVSSTILRKKSALNEAEWQEIRNHPVYSYQMVKSISILKPETKLAILQHHERLNGSGYPMGETGLRIHTQSKIIAIADIYHAMTTKKAYKETKSPFKTLQVMEEDLFGQLDIKIFKILSEAIASFSVGAQLELSDGRVGEVIYKKHDANTRPLIKIIDSDDIIDLERNRQLYIEKVINE
ncbi:HD domain-containing phosphohydrolase [Bacillus sp. FJAT-50079]|uniref:HD-GYP domain-containing protein n=1 Tax=Bacillus sp. FJAT-50079 TaxID=2833577 RepID=UPI001BC964D1|nr:HD domain-containing phosphohydrolase [Bacillus sp. FJAT-50079]MBS4207180.1 HD domain-containing protein [Bacillus sp. FJAT-50079]